MEKKKLEPKKLIDWEKGDKEGNRKIFFQNYHDFTKELLPPNSLVCLDGLEPPTLTL